MVRYRLTQDNMDIDFNQIPDFNNLNNNRLEDIVKFTGVFKSEEELRNYLKHYKLIQTDKPLRIKYRYCHKDKTVIYGPSYFDDLKFIDVRNIKTFLINNRYNIEFLNNLCRHYRNSYNNDANIFAIRKYICVLSQKQEAMDDATEIINDFDASIMDFVRYECYKSASKVSEYDKPIFRNIRDLGMFLSVQSQRNNLLNTTCMDNQSDIMKYALEKRNSININDNELTDISVKVKTKTKMCKGQMTFKVKEDGTLTY